MTKRLTTLLGALFLAVPLFAGEDWQPQAVGPFGTLNNRDNSFSLPADKAQDLLNVDITPGGKSVRKRKGYGLVFSLAITTSPVHGVYTFFDSNGNEVSLFFNDTRMSSSISGLSPSVLFSTGSNGATYQCTDSLGFAYCANSARTTLTKTNGATYSNIQNVSSTGTMVATCVTRLAMAGFSDRPSGIDFSADSDFTTWGTGSIGTSPVQLTINAPGARITHITYAFNRLMWFKDTSFGFVLIGNQPAQSDWVVKTVSYDVGTNDNSSVYREGILYFRGKDGHIYSFDGSTYQRLSREISATINSSQTKGSNSWTQTTQASFGSGLFIPTTYVDTETVSGSIQMTYPDNFSSFRDGSNGSKNVWKSFTVNNATTAAVSSNNLVLTSTGSSEQYVRTVSPSANYKTGTTYYVVLSSIPFDPLLGHSVFTIYFSSIGTNSGNPSNLNDYLFFGFGSTESNKLSQRNFQDMNETLCASCFTGHTSTFPAKIAIWLSTSNYSVTINDSLIKAGGFSYTNNPLFVYMGYFNASSASRSAAISNFNIVPETFTFQSTVNNAPNLTSWDTLNVTNQQNSGTLSFFTRASTNTIAINSSTPSWTTINSGAVPSISTGTYFQFRGDFSLLYATGTSPKIDDFTQNWFEGSASDKAYATYFEDRILWSVTSGTAATTNNRILIYDLMNQGWLLYDLASNGFFVRQNRLYFGSATTGNVFKYGDNDNDNGSAINAYWKSKDFFGGNPFTTQEIANISVAAGSVANSSMTVTYTLNGSTSSSFIISLDSANNMFPNKNKNLPGGTIGGSYNIKFGNNAADQSFEVFGIQVGIRPKSWVPN